MMKQELIAKCDKQSMQVNRLAYLLYMVLVAYLFFKGDIEWAITNLGIAMIFDPFDAKVKWQNRPPYQKVWLIVHVALTFVGFLYLVLR
jgi:hypothetical protein